jgi:hypothetical protein
MFQQILNFKISNFVEIRSALFKLLDLTLGKTEGATLTGAPQECERA